MAEHRVEKCIIVWINQEKKNAMTCVYQIILSFIRLNVQNEEEKVQENFVKKGLIVRELTRKRKM